jgi:hypothetical protein
MIRFIIPIFALFFLSSVAHGQTDTVTDTVNPNEDTIITDNTSRIDSKTTVYSPPPSAIAPTINSSNSDLCTVGVSGAVQTQILGLSAGKTVRDMNCEKLKNSKTLYDMGMKVAAVSVMCQDKRVFDAMMHAGTPCPYNGLIGQEARLGWQEDEEASPKEEDTMRSVMEDDNTITLIGGAIVISLFALLSIL